MTFVACSLRSARFSTFPAVFFGIDAHESLLARFVVTKPNREHVNLQEVSTRSEVGTPDVKEGTVSARVGAVDANV